MKKANAATVSFDLRSDTDPGPSDHPSRRSFMTSAFSTLDYYIHKAPDAHYVSLQGFDIHDLGPFLPGLARLHAMRQLSLAHNALERLPEDMSMLQSVETLDLSRNRFSEASTVIKGLFSMPQLRHLKINLSEAQEEVLVGALSGLKSLNGIPLDTEEYGEDLAEDLGSVLTPQVSRSMEGEGSPRTGATYRHKVLMARRGYDTTTTAARYDFSPWTSECSDEFTKLYQLCSKVSGSAANASEFDEFHGIVVAHLRARTREDGDTLKHQTQKFNASTLLLEYCAEEVVRASVKYGHEIHVALRALMKMYAQRMQHASVVMMALQDERDRRIAALQKDLAALLVLHEHSRFGAEEDAGEGQTPELNDFIETMADNRRLAEQKGAIIERQELVRLINLIMESKSIHDDTNREAHLPHETVEQHVYTYFTKRLSNPAAIRSAVASVLNSVAAYEKWDMDVSVFAHLVRFNIEEGFWFYLKKLTYVIYDATHAVLSDQSGGGGSSSDVLQGHLSEEQVTRILNAIFPLDDNAWRVREIVAWSRRIADERRETFSAAALVGYRNFASLVLKQTLQKKLDSTRHITAAFRKLDRQRTGVIDAVQMRMLIHDVAPDLPGTMEQNILKAVDPFNNNVVTYSDAVTALLRHVGKSSSADGSPQQESRPLALRSPARDAAENLGRKK